MTKIKVKEWVIDKAQETASRYNTYIDFARNEDGTRKVENGFLTVNAEILKETEKAINVKLTTGDVVGTTKGWTLWIPKSQMEF